MTRVSRDGIVRMSLVACLAWALLPLAAQAQQSSILVVRAPRVPASLQRELAQLFSPLGEIVPDTDYAKTARQMRLSPHDPRAIVALLPGLGISLVVTIETTTRDAGRYLRLSYRSPETGDEVVKDELPYRGGPLPSSYRNWVVSQARLALSTLGSRAGQRPAVTPPEFGDSDTTQTTAPTPGDQYADNQASSDDASFRDSDDTQASEDSALPPRVLQMEGVVGLGLGQRAVSLPTQSGARQLEVGPFLMVDGAVRSRLRLSESFQLLLALRYYTSVGLNADSTPAAGVPQSVPLRSQRMEAVLGALGRLGVGETVPWIALHIGYAVQDLRGLIEITMPRYSLGGPFARLDLRALVADGSVTLWAMPEAQWLVAVDNNLTRLHVSSTGFALGGELGVSVRISEQFLWEASYRESHSFVGTLQSDSFHDLERVLTTRLVVQR